MSVLTSYVYFKARLCDLGDCFYVFAIILSSKKKKKSQSKADVNLFKHDIVYNATLPRNLLNFCVKIYEKFFVYTYILLNNLGNSPSEN